MARRETALRNLSAFLEKGSEWKASADSIEQFAVALVNASDPERERLLADNKKMVTTELRDALRSQGRAAQAPGSYDRAIALLRLAEKLCEQLGDKAGIATVNRRMGDIFLEWEPLADAVKHYQDARSDV